MFHWTHAPTSANETS